MRMARPSERDIDTAGELIQVLDIIDAHWGGPSAIDGPQDLTEALADDDFDADDKSHLQGLYNHLAKLLRRSPNFHGRVIGGMCYVICYDRNAFLDPASSTLDFHPDIRDGLKLLAQQRRDFLPSLERRAREAVAEVIERAAARHLREMAASWAAPGRSQVRIVRSPA